MNNTIKTNVELTNEEINILITCTISNKIYCIDKNNGEKLKNILYKILKNTNNKKIIEIISDNKINKYNN